MNWLVLGSLLPHVIAAIISLQYDIKSWYDTIAATAVVLSVTIQFQRHGFSYRGTLHTACILLGVISQEVSRQSRSIDWDRLVHPYYLGYYMCLAHLIKGTATLIKILPTVTVIRHGENTPTTWRDYVGWSMSIITSVYFLQEPNIYRNQKAMAEWRWTFTLIETFHWAGLSLSASTHFKSLNQLVILFATLQALASHWLFMQLAA